MKKTERIREILHRPLDENYLKQRAETGWHLAAVEWEREVEAAQPAASPSKEELPFGLRISDDCLHLEEHPDEMKALRLLMELIVQDASFSRMADELNRAGYTTRDGGKWDVVRIFYVLPRVIEASPRILASEDWKSRRERMTQVAWNS